MSDELKRRAEKAVAELESAAEMLRSSYFVGLVESALERAVVGANSPWLDRAGAAAHCRCSTSEIDRAADAGVFTRYHRGGTPLFKRAEIDAAIEEGRWPRRASR